VELEDEIVFAVITDSETARLERQNEVNFVRAVKRNEKI